MWWVYGGKKESEKGLSQKKNKSKPKTEKNADPKAVMTDKTDDLATLNGPSYTR